MTHIEQLHLEAIEESKDYIDTVTAYAMPVFAWGVKEEAAAFKSAEITENIACEFAIFFNGLMPMNCKQIMRRQDLSDEQKVKLVFKKYLKTKENDTPNN
jgi:hypothetical protein